MQFFVRVWRAKLWNLVLLSVSERDDELGEQDEDDGCWDSGNNVDWMLNRQNSTKMVMGAYLDKNLTLSTIMLYIKYYKMYSYQIV